MSESQPQSRSLLLRAGSRVFRVLDSTLPHGPLADRQVMQLRYWRAHGRLPRALSDRRATFNDFIYHRMVSNDWTPLERACIDKQYAKIIASGMCPALRISATRRVLPLKGSCSIARAACEIVARAGRQEVAKPTHGSGAVLFLRRSPSLPEAQAFCETAAQSYYRTSRESQYRRLERKLILEEDLSRDGVPPPDYKFFCVKGEVLFCQVDVGRFVDHRRVLVSPGYEPIAVRYAHDAPDEMPSKPRNFEAMLAAAAALSRHFLFMRIDLYSTGDAVYFGEFTFAPEGGAGSLSSEEFGISVMARIRAAQEEEDTP